MRSLNIGISARGLNSHFSGPREYIEGFINALVKQAAPHQIFLYYNTEKFVGSHPQAVEQTLPETNYLIWDHILFPKALARDGIDVAIFPKGVISMFSPCRTVSIMLDMGYFYPKLNAYKLMDTLYQRIFLKYSARKAWGVFTISQHTADDVVHLTGASRERVQNIYGGVNDHMRPVQDAAQREMVQSRYGIQTPYMFYPTSISPRKNIDRVLDAFEKIQHQIPHHLYFTGNVSWNSAPTENRIKKMSDRVHRLGSVQPDDMPALYSMADFTIYPSLFEGLGLPLLEAFKCGSPAMTSDQSCLPEVAGDAALIVEGYNAASISAGMLKLANDIDLRQALRQKGLERVKNFTWENTAQTALNWINTHWE